MFPHDPTATDRRAIPMPEGGTQPFRSFLTYIASATLTGCPATVAPVGLSASGFPVGLQIVGCFSRMRRGSSSPSSSRERSEVSNRRQGTCSLSASDSRRASRGGLIRLQNLRAVREGRRVFLAYELRDGARISIITEPTDR